MYGPRLWAIVRGVWRGSGGITHGGLLALATVRRASSAWRFIGRSGGRLAGARGRGFLVRSMNWSTRRSPAAARSPRWGGGGHRFAQALQPCFAASPFRLDCVRRAVGGLGPSQRQKFSFLLAIPVIAGAALIESRTWRERRGRRALPLA